MKNQLAISILATIIFTGCFKEEVVIKERPDGWSYLSHSPLAPVNSDEIFSNTEVKRLDIVITEDAWEVMQNDLEDLYGGSSSGGAGGGPGGGGPGGGEETSFSDETPITIPCQMYYNGIQWFDVGIRYKGNSSLQSGYSSGKGKLPFRIDMDAYDKVNPLIEDQRFYGHEELSLSSNYEDVSLMHEKVVGDLFRDFGVPAPRSSYYEMYVDYGDGPVYFGLYTMVEVVFDTMLKDRFGSNTGNCYKPDGEGATFSNGSFNTDDFENKTNSGASWSDVESLYDIINSSDRTSNTEQWKTDLESVFDVDGFLKWLAANTTIQNWDTYGVMTHNYYMYNDPSDGLLKWIPWDNNEALSDSKSKALNFNFSSINDDDWPLIGYLYNEPEYKSIYDDYIDDFIATTFNSSRVSAIYDDYWMLIEPSVSKESGIYTYTSASDFSSSLGIQQSHVASRNSAAANYTP